MDQPLTPLQGKRSLLRVYSMGGAQIGNAPYIGDGKGTNEEWIRFGRNNLFPEFCRALADNCSPLDACVNTMAQYIAGNGLEFLDENEKPIPAAMRKWEELCGEDGEDAILEATALDLALMNTMSWEVIYSNARPLQLQHLDVTRVRLGKKNQEGMVDKYYFSSNWSQYKQPGYRPEPIDAWGARNKGKALLYRKAYKQLRDYYGEPHWMASMADAEVLVRIPVFNRTQIETGFKPSVHAHLTTNADAENIDEIDENFETAFTGEDGKPYVLTVGSTGETLQITKLERGDHAGELDKTRTVSKEEIFHSYGIPPVLMGVNVNTGLSGKGLAISEELSLFDRTKVRPKQKHIAVSAKKLLAACGIDVPIVRVKTLVPFEPAEDPALVRQTYLRRMLVGEDRLKSGMPVITTDGKEAKEDRSNWTPWMLQPLIAVSANMNPEQDATQNANQ